MSDTGRIGGTVGHVADVIPFSAVDGPGNRFVVFLQGCNFDCIACHNPQTIPLESIHARTVTPESMLDEIKRAVPHISGVTVSGGEATLQPRFVYELFAAIKADPVTRLLTTFIDTNGSAENDVWELLLPVTDGFMIDLKAFSDTLHIELTGKSNVAVLHAIRYLSRAGKLYETRLMLAPGINDSDEELRSIAAWLLSVDPAMRIKVNHFHAHGTRHPASEWPEADDERKAHYATVLRSAGVINLA